MSVGDLDINASVKKAAAPKEKRFLLNELHQIKEQLHQKLFVFKQRAQGKRVVAASGNQEAGVTEQFEIGDGMELEDILRKEIDHFFIMTQILNTIVLKGDETYRTMQSLAKLTND